MHHIITLTIGFLIYNSPPAFSQDDVQSLNLQFHYDLRRDHPTITQEFYATDRLGYTFFFMDINFNHTPVEGIPYKAGGMSDVYFEFMRYFRLKQLSNGSLNLTIQYDDGSEPVKQVWLAGLNVSDVKLANFFLSTEFLLKKEYRLGVNWQYTLVWYATFWKNRLVFNGYLDFWVNDVDNENWPAFDPEFKATRYSFQAEPQFGYALSSHWKVGSELEISRGFLGSVTGKLALKEKYRHDRWYILPTVFIQYTF